MLSQSWKQLKIMKNKKKTIKNETSVMADLIIMSAIVHLQIDGYQF